MPPQVRKRGRPKGVYASVIGIPKKRKKGPFKLMTNKEKEKMILWWLLKEKAKDCLDYGHVITDKDVPKHGDMANELLDENVNISVVFKHFTTLAFTKAEHMLKMKRLKVKWMCHVCSEEADGHTIGCETCLKWYHLKCVSLKKKPKIRNWICRQCSRRNNSICKSCFYCSDLMIFDSYYICQCI